MNIYTQNDTIAAVATPVGTGGIGIVRLSGSESFNVMEKIFSSSLHEKKLPVFKANRIYYGWIHEDLKPVDEVILLCFHSPNSFTGEDILEIQCHGGINVVRQILQLCLKNGARLAEPGEFSRRAFMNGKLDLSKAEAVIDLIHARTDRFSRESALNLSGRLTEKTNLLRTEILDLLSRITAAVDFPEEVDEPAYEHIQNRTGNIILEIENILSYSASSNLMRNGVKAVIAGRPNAGKSSLFNALLDAQRAIVTEIPGTTRDIIQESIDLDGIPLTLIDTAGLRELDDSSQHSYIESLGINLTKETLEISDVIIYMYDLTRGMTQEDVKTLERLKSRDNVLKVGSKLDLAKGVTADNGVIKISSKDKTGLVELKKAVKEIILSNPRPESEFCTNLRQQQCLRDSREFLLKVLGACQNRDPQDLVCIDLKSALTSLGEITGEVVSEEIIDNIFSSFCIGK